MVEVSGLFTQSMNKEPLPGVQWIEAQHEKPGERDELAVYHHFSHLALTSSELSGRAECLSFKKRAFLMPSFHFLLTVYRHWRINRRRSSLPRESSIIGECFTVSGETKISLLRRFMNFPCSIFNRKRFLVTEKGVKNLSEMMRTLSLLSQIFSASVNIEMKTESYFQIHFFPNKTWSWGFRVTSLQHNITSIDLAN